MLENYIVTGNVPLPSVRPKVDLCAKVIVMLVVFIDCTSIALSAQLHRLESITVIYCHTLCI